MSKDRSIKDVTKTRELLVYDSRDRVRMSLHAHGDVEPKITIYKEDGTPAIEISSMEMDSDSRRIVLFGKAHHWRLYITSTDKGTGMTVFHNDGKLLKTWDLQRTKPKRTPRRSGPAG
jgi:hypothetical protein